MKKLLFVLLLVLLVTAGIITGTFLIQSNKSLNETALGIQVVKPSPSITNSVLPGNPVRITIPAIDVQADIEQVGLDSEGRMDVPRTAYSVAWYSLGYKPGQKGNAVLAGHLDQQNGSPAVFWNVPKLKVGDKINVTDDSGDLYSFEVTNIMQYPYNNFPLQEVFGEANKSQLNLITCTGEWDNAQKNYSHRTVIYSELIEEI